MSWHNAYCFAKTLANAHFRFLIGKCYVNHVVIQASNVEGGREEGTEEERKGGSSGEKGREGGRKEGIKHYVRVYGMCC